MRRGQAEGVRSDDGDPRESEPMWPEPRTSKLQGLICWGRAEGSEPVLAELTHTQADK